MAKGFFKASQVQSKRTKKIGTLAQCKRCGLYKSCKSPKMPPTGKGTVKILYVAEAPGSTEDQKNEQLVGQAGQLLSSILRELGMNLNDGMKTNACCCRPPSNDKPTTTQIDACRPNVMKAINEFQPHVIVPLGSVAVKSIIQPRFQGDVGGINKWRGFLIPDRGYQAWVCPAFHPSYIDRDTTPEVAEKIFKDDLKHALKMLDVPFPTYKNEQDCVEIIKHPDQATAWLKDLFRKEIRLVAFDYETTGLKPQRPDQEIKSCAISYDVDHAVSFPVFTDDFEFMEVFTHFLSTPKIKKIAANTKYERDWSNVKLNCPVNGFFFDTMIAAHCLDNRTGITSLDFQGYVNFGIEQYDHHLKKFLKPDDSGGNDLNDIDEVDLKDLLIYGGMDALGEFKLGLVQMDLLGIDYSHLYDKKRGLDMCPQLKEIFDEKSKNRKKRVSRKQ